MTDAAPYSAADRPIALAVIIGAHGVTGEVRLKLFSDDMDGFRRYGSFAAGHAGTLTLKAIRPGPNGAVARFAEIGDRNQAEALRGFELTVPRSALPPLAAGEFYHCDLIGLDCVSSDGGAVGRVVAVENFGAGDILDIERPDGRRFMVPVHAVSVGAVATIEAAYID